MATCSSILACKIPRTEEPGGYSPWGRKESDTTEHTHTTIWIDLEGTMLFEINQKMTNSVRFYFYVESEKNASKK